MMVSAIVKEKKQKYLEYKLNVFYSLFETWNLLLYLITSSNTITLIVMGIKNKNHNI